MASTYPTPEDDVPFEDRRAFPRVPVAMPAFLHVDGVRRSAHLLDLSAGGAKLRCADCPASGSAVMLDCGSLSRSAVVRWQDGNVLGMAFDEELDAREVTALIARSIALDALMKTRG